MVNATVRAETDRKALEEKQKQDLVLVATEGGLDALALKHDPSSLADFQWASVLQDHSSNQTQQETELVEKELKFALLAKDLQDGEGLKKLLNAYIGNVNEGQAGSQTVVKAMNVICQGFAALHRLSQLADLQSQPKVSEEVVQDTETGGSNALLFKSLAILLNNSPDAASKSEVHQCLLS